MFLPYHRGCILPTVPTWLPSHPTLGCIAFSIDATLTPKKDATIVLDILYAGLNVTVGTLSPLFGLFILRFLMKGETQGRGKGAAACTLAMSVCFMLIHCLVHGLLFFKFPAQFYQYGHFAILLLFVEAIATHVTLYREDDFDLKRCLIFTSVLACLALQLILFESAFRHVVFNLT